MKDFFQEAFSVLAIVLALLAFVLTPIVFIDIKQCSSYATIKQADNSEYIWFQCYITKDNKTLTKGEYKQSEVGYLIKGTK